jgi:glycosyltransferase involved in cell wall biosynthesis
MLAARSLVLPSVWYEGQPLVALEALSAGLPVLASAIGGLQELLGLLGQPWLVPPGAVEAWTLALRRLAEPSVVAAASGRARALYEQAFSPGTAIRALEDGYARAVARRAEEAGR